MLLKLTNAFVTLQRVVNKTLYYFLNKIVIVYINNILINLTNLTKHRKYVLEVLKCF